MQEGWRWTCLFLSLPPPPHLLGALLTGGAWLVMSREVARLAGTNRLPPLIVYDVSFPSSPFFILPSAPLTQSSLFSPRVYGKFWFIQGSVEVRANQEWDSILLWMMRQMPHLLDFSLPWYIGTKQSTWSGRLHSTTPPLETPTLSHTLVNGRM